jgi:hypothetical protein
MFIYESKTHTHTLTHISTIYYKYTTYIIIFIYILLRAKYVSLYIS